MDEPITRQRMKRMKFKIEYNNKWYRVEQATNTLFNVFYKKRINSSSIRT